MSDELRAIVEKKASGLVDLEPAQVDFIVDLLEDRTSQVEALKEIGQKLRDYEGMKSPIGPLHSVGYNEAVAEVVKMFDEAEAEVK